MFDRCCFSSGFFEVEADHMDCLSAAEGDKIPELVALLMQDGMASQKKTTHFGGKEAKVKAKSSKKISATLSLP